MATDSNLSASDSSPVSARRELLLAPGVVLAQKYRLIRPTGIGGMGAVWVAVNMSTGAEVAIKLLLPEHAEYAEAVERFRHEAHATAQLSHRGIVRIFDLVDVGTKENASVAIVLELLHGRTLAALLDERQKLPVPEALEIVLPLLNALTHAHAAGIIHRDLKPENVFLAVDPDGLVTPKILDFGISKLRAARDVVVTGDGRTVGTPGYMSPEQARGLATIDHRSDLFNVGILLYEMLAGENPFSSSQNLQAVVAVLERDPAPLSNVSPELWKVIARTLDKDADARYADAHALAAALRTACGLRGSWPTPPSYAREVQEAADSRAVLESRATVAVKSSAPRKHPRRKAYAGGALVGLVVAAAFFTMAFGSGSRAAGPDRRSSLVVGVTTAASENHTLASVAPAPLLAAAPMAEAPVAEAASAPDAKAKPVATHKHRIVKSASASSTIVRDPGF